MQPPRPPAATAAAAEQLSFVGAGGSHTTLSKGRIVELATPVARGHGGAQA